MPVSLKCKLEKLKHNGQINNDEYNSMIKKLNGHDMEIKRQLITKLTDIAAEQLMKIDDYKSTRDYFYYSGVAAGVRMAIEIIKVRC